MGRQQSGRLNDLPAELLICLLFKSGVYYFPNSENSALENCPLKTTGRVNWLSHQQLSRGCSIVFIFGVFHYITLELFRVAYKYKTAKHVRCTVQN